MNGVDRASSGTASAASALRSTAASVVAAPTHSWPSRRSMPCRPAMRPTSTRWSNTARRRASRGTRLWPPARTLASSPSSASAAAASSAVPGAWYWNGAGFTTRDHSACERSLTYVGGMTTDGLGYDPYDPELNRDPYPAFRRLREEAPLYYNEEHDFYALSRHADVEKGLVDWQTFPSGRGAIIEIIQAGVELPPGTLIFEDPPIHDIHRGLLSRVFTPRKMAALEDKVREFCARCLDPMVGTGRFDLIADLGALMPMWTIGMLLGIPEGDQSAIRDRADANLRTRPGEKMAVEGGLDIGADMFADYVAWRAEHPSDDLMTELLTAEFEDETGATRTLTRDEVLTYVMVIAGAGNETTTRLIGWAGTVLADHPDQRKQLAGDRTLL